MQLGIKRWVKSLLDKNFIGNTYGLARSVCAFGLLVTLLLNSSNELFYIGRFEGITSQNIPNLLAYTSLFHIIGYENVFSSKLISISILLLVVIGYRPRFTGVLHFWVNYSFYFSSFAINGGDQIALLCSIYVLPFTLLDSRKWHWFGKSKSGNNILAKSIIINSYFLIRIQTALIYLVAGVSKFNVIEWANGTALYYWFNNQSFGIPDHLSFLLQLFDNDIILSFTTYSVLIFELTLFLGLTMVKRGKKILFAVAVSFHFLIFLFHGLFSFFFSITSLLILYLLPLDEQLKLKTNSYA